ncbi:A disintegrin and metalloproteinase with thrombospondin motifs 18-like isoform X2 [Pecten maximus]|uniref:A disintegrin and metalloproteinase with thrombospondin motifs 18-like isoform X2 n=1 Tax=Pecten maximus TaxID=6579 RepID=UPI001457F327|nr:A disintegrin and metalloproteinase with thrombospondin motifs 18-like isoform X2 [Pecten maximus]
MDSKITLRHLIVSIVVLMVTSQGFSKSVHQIVDDDIRKYHTERQPRDSGFEEFTVTQLIEKGIGDSAIPFVSASVYRRKRSLEETKKKLAVEFKAFDETFTLEVQHQTSVIHPNAKIVLTNGDKEEEWNGPHPDCFLTGNVTSHNSGTVSLSYCDNLEGGMWTGGYEYHIMTLPERLHKRDTASSNVHSVLVSRRHLGTSLIDSLHLQKDSIRPEEDSSGRKKRTAYVIPSTSFTMEMAVYTDADFTALFTYSDVSLRITAIATKYNGVQAEWSRASDLGYTVTIVIKHINMFETNPVWYTASTALGTILSQICQGAATSDDEPYDIIFLHTGISGVDLGGLAYQNRICKDNNKCGVSASRSLVTYIATAHEIGHNIGMYHDADKGCTGDDTGVMGGRGVRWSTCSKADMQAYLATGNAQCLWETNIPSANVSAELQSISLTGELIGQTLLEDEVCEVLYGSGFRFREYPNFSNCGLFTCVNMNRGTTYGQMYKESSSISGNYCEDGKVCFKGSCSDLATAQLTGATVTAGGWSNWESWSTCSRTCGTGVLHRRRICNNPRPKNHAFCPGDQYEAELCNTTPCLGDSTTESTLITARASETCYALVQYGVIDIANYFPTGTVYNNVRMGKCEVKCDRRTGYTPEAYTRYGLMPDGTPCNEVLHEWDEKDWPRRPGYEDYCLEGYCYVFGCDNKLNGQQYDQCGVCGGDNSTCLFYNSVYTDSVAQGDRVTIVQLPAGSFNIQFWFTYSQMNNDYVELWSKDDRAIIASRVYSSWVHDTEDSPIYHAGAYWSFYFNTQYLLGKGVLTNSVIIKFFNLNGNPNLGVNYAYSTPLNVGSCTGTCQNGGTWDSSLCACSCPENFYSLDCSSSCNTECLNGGTVIEDTCGCQCNNQSFGNKCQTCKVPYTGQGCQSCAGATCQNCGVFDSATCRCRCLDGYGGTSCETTCADTSSTCAADAAAGKCDSDNINMEANCPLTCGLCVAKSPPDNCSTAIVISSTTTTTTTTTSQPSTSTCLTDEFTCTNGNCVSVNVTCDRTDDCGDFSDELGTCMSSTVQPSTYTTTSTSTKVITTTGSTTTSTGSATTTKAITMTGSTASSAGSTTTTKATTSTGSTTTTEATTSTGSKTTTKGTSSTSSTTTTKSTTSTGSTITTKAAMSTGNATSTTTTTVPQTQNINSTFSSTTITSVTSTTSALTQSASTTEPTTVTKPLTTKEIITIVGIIAGVSVLILAASGYALYITKLNDGNRAKMYSGTQPTNVIQTHPAGDGYHELTTHEKNGDRDSKRHSKNGYQSGINYHPSGDVFKNYDYV